MGKTNCSSNLHNWNLWQSWAAPQKCIACYWSHLVCDPDWCFTETPYRKLFIYLFYALSLFTKTVLLHRIIPPATIRDQHLQQHKLHSTLLHFLNKTAIFDFKKLSFPPFHILSFCFTEKDKKSESCSTTIRSMVSLRLMQKKLIHTYRTFKLQWLPQFQAKNSCAKELGRSDVLSS